MHQLACRSLGSSKVFFVREPFEASGQCAFVHQQQDKHDHAHRRAPKSPLHALCRSYSSPFLIQLSLNCSPHVINAVQSRGGRVAREKKAIDPMSASGPTSIANNKGSSLAELSIDFAKSLRLDVDLNNVGSRFHDQGGDDGADRYPATTVENGYDFGSLAASARLADEVDDITQQTTGASLEDSTYTGAVGPAHDSNSYSTHFTQQRPVYTSWQPRCTKADSSVTPSLDDLPAQKRAVGSSLAPQSSSDESVNEAPRPVPAQGKRPSYDRPLLPANPVQYQHPPRPREEPPIAAQPPRSAHASQPQPQIAPRPSQFAPQTTEDYGCSECGKVFNRKSDLV